MTDVKLIGLTGGIGMGKSTSATLLRERGIPLIDTDDLARQVVEPGQPALVQIRAAFGESVFDPEGRLRRDQLAPIVFASIERRRALEAITHPQIRSRWEEAVRTWRSQGSKLGVVVIPLLFETAAESAFDSVVCVACSSRAQQERLLLRGWSAEAIQSRIGAQWRVDRKMTCAQFVVWSEGPLEVLVAQWERILTRLA